jgi:hypothetical protein
VIVKSEGLMRPLAESVGAIDNRLPGPLVNANNLGRNRVLSTPRISNATGSELDESSFSRGLFRSENM